MYLRQIALVAEDLEPVKQQFFTLFGDDLKKIFCEEFLALLEFRPPW